MKVPLATHGDAPEREETPHLRRGTFALARLMNFEARFSETEVEDLCVRGAHAPTGFSDEDTELALNDVHRLRARVAVATPSPPPRRPQSPSGRPRRDRRAPCGR